MLNETKNSYYRNSTTDAPQTSKMCINHYPLSLYSSPFHRMVPLILWCVVTQLKGYYDNLCCRTLIKGFLSV